MNNPSDFQTTFEAKMPELIEKFKSTLVDNLQSSQQEFDYQSYYRNLISEKNT